MSPARICARVSFTQVGHNESVVRGQPNTGDDFSQLLSRGAGAHFGLTLAAGNLPFTNCRSVHPTFAAEVTAASKTRPPIIRPPPGLPRRGHYRVSGWFCRGGARSPPDPVCPAGPPAARRRPRSAEAPCEGPGAAHSAL